jgi:hypothetical protein
MPQLLVPPEAHLVGRSPCVARVRPVAVVQKQKVVAVPIDLTRSRKQPDVPSDRLLEGPEDPLDSAVRAEELLASLAEEAVEEDAAVANKGQET